MSEKKYTVGIYTLGCKVNQYESEAIMEAFEANGFSSAAPDEKCDVYVINTCTVTAESDRKAKQFIRRAIGKNPDAFILVTGCLAQTSADDIAEIRGVDYICGNTNKLSVVDAAKALIESGKKAESARISVESVMGAGFESMTIEKFDRTRAYIKIEDGCESRCTYCTIPAARGTIRSKGREEVLAEVCSLVRGGCREIVLTGIETSYYGKDLDGYSLVDLLEDIDKIEGIGRVRLGSMDPASMNEKFVSRVAKLKSFAPHFHLSIQSGSSHVLALMKRKYNRDMALDAIRRLREAIPGVKFTTDVIVGFPGETEEDFLDTVAFAKEARFLMMHIFPYSKRGGTPAATMDGQIPKEIKKERGAILAEVQKEIRASVLAEKVEESPECEVLFETYRDGYAYGHTADFVEVRVPSPRPLASEIHRVRLVGSTAELCFGELIG